MDDIKLFSKDGSELKDILNNLKCSVTISILISDEKLSFKKGRIREAYSLDLECVTKSGRRSI